MSERPEQKFAEEIKFNIEPVESLITGIKPSEKENYIDDDIATAGINDFDLNSLEYFEIKDYIKPLYSQQKEDYDRLMANLKGTTVVDLGAGKYPNGYLYAAVQGAAGYVGVEYSWHSQELTKEAFTNKGSKIYARLRRDLASLGLQNSADLPRVSLVHQDMLTFLRRLPNDSVSVISGGIDWTIIENKKYQALANEEIKRVLNPKGVLVSYGVENVLRLQEGQEIEKIHTPVMDAYIKRKK